MLKGFTIEDNITTQSHGAVEVRVHLDDGTERWCYFFTPDGLANCGDLIDGTAVRIHYKSPYMIVVSELNEQIIEGALRHLDARGELEKCSMRLEDPK